MGAMATYVVGAATKLGLADVIGDRVCSTETVAEAYGVPAERMVRLLRALAALGLCVEESAGQFGLTEAGSFLRTDHPESAHALVRMFTDPIMLHAWADLDTSVRTGKPAFDAVFGKPFFGHLADRPEMSALFNASMSQATRAVAAFVPDHFDFGRFRTIADIGGGDGTLLAAILNAHPQPRGILFDTAEGSAQAVATLAPMQGRCSIVVGDFFETAPAGVDCYVLKSVIHDWNDEQAGRILQHCRAAVPADGVLVVIEPVLPDLVEPGTSPGLYLSDMNMLVNLGGRERTRAEFAKLFADNGFELIETIALPPEIGFSVLVATPNG